MTNAEVDKIIDNTLVYNTPLLYTLFNMKVDVILEAHLNEYLRIKFINKNCEIQDKIM
jgi:hypothetical protein